MSSRPKSLLPAESLQQAMKKQTDIRSRYLSVFCKMRFFSAGWLLFVQNCLCFLPRKVL